MVQTFFFPECGEGHSIHDVTSMFLLFGTLKDGSLHINNLASNNCVNYRNVSQNGVNALSKLIIHFLPKSSKFLVVYRPYDFVQISPACGTILTKECVASERL